LAYTLYVENAVEDSASASAPLEYIQGHGNLISGLEKELEGMAVGEKKNVTIAPKDAYGEYDPEALIELERSLFPADFPIEKGRMVPLEDDEGNHLHSYIQEWNDSTVTVDLNHPMAGKTLVFDCEIVSLRPGTEEEIKAGSIYLDDGCGCDDCSSCGHHCH
jgi:FKBP-type peptidyl-prolyl cis-trans isomerase SlyD